MKKLSVLLLCALLACSCTDKEKEKIEINQVNWNSYCSFKMSFLGIEDKNPKCRIYFYVDSNYSVVKQGWVSAHTTYHLHDYGDNNEKRPIDMRVDFCGFFTTSTTELDYVAGWTGVNTEWYLDSIDDVVIDSINGTIQKK